MPYSPLTTKDRTTDQPFDPIAPPNTLGDEMRPITLALIFRTLYGGRRVIQIVTLSIFLLAVAITFILPKTYTSSATFIPPGSNNSSGLSAIMGQMSLMGGGGILGAGGKSQGELYVGVLKSRSVQALMVDWFHLKTNYKTKSEASAEALLLKNSTFEVGIKDPIVTITVTDRNPATARDLTEGYLRALQETNVRLALTESSQRRAFFEQRLEREKEALADAEVNFQKSQKQTGLIAPAGQTAINMQTLANLQAQITSRQVQLASLLHSEAEENPDVIGIRREIQALQAQVKEHQSGQARKEFGAFSTSQVPALQMEYIRSARDVKYHETLFEIIAKQYEAARLDEAKEAPIQILDHGNIPEVPSGPRRKLIVGIGLIAGVVLGAAFVLGREAFSGKQKI
jgi:tyrosine-protein kinase Etk/Wzc